MKGGGVTSGSDLAFLIAWRRRVDKATHRFIRIHMRGIMPLSPFLVATNRLDKLWMLFLNENSGRHYIIIESLYLSNNNVLNETSKDFGELFAISFHSIFCDSV